MKRFKTLICFSRDFSGKGFIFFILFILNGFCFSFSSEEILTTSFLSPSSRFEEEKTQVLKELDEAEGLADQVIALKAAPSAAAQKKEEAPVFLKGKSKAVSHWISASTGYSSGGLEVDRAGILVPSYNYFIRHVVDTAKKVEPSSPGSETRKIKDFDADDGVQMPEIVRNPGEAQSPSQGYQPSGEMDLFLKSVDEKTAPLLSMESSEILFKKKVWYEALLRIETQIAKGVRNPYQTSEDKSRLLILKNYFMILLDKSDLVLASKEGMMNQIRISG